MRKDRHYNDSDWKLYINMFDAIPSKRYQILSTDPSVIYDKYGGHRNNGQPKLYSSSIINHQDLVKHVNFLNSEYDAYLTEFYEYYNVGNK